MFDKLRYLNENKRVIKASKVLLLLSIGLLFFVFVSFKQTEYNLASPLVPDYLVYEIFKSLALGGLVLCFITFFSYLFQMNEQYFLALLLSIGGIFLQALIIQFC